MEIWLKIGFIVSSIIIFILGISGGWELFLCLRHRFWPRPLRLFCFAVIIYYLVQIFTSSVCYSRPHFFAVGRDLETVGGLLVDYRQDNGKWPEKLTEMETFYYGMDGKYNYIRPTEVNEFPMIPQVLLFGECQDLILYVLLEYIPAKSGQVPKLVPQIEKFNLGPGVNCPRVESDIPYFRIQNLAADAKFAEAIKLIAELPLEELEYQDVNGMTLLMHFAARSECRTLAEALLKRNVNTQARNVLGFTAGDIAVYYDNNQISGLKSDYFPLRSYQIEQELRNIDGVVICLIFYLMVLIKWGLELFRQRDEVGPSRHWLKKIGILAVRAYWGCLSWSLGSDIYNAHALEVFKRRQLENFEVAVQDYYRQHGRWPDNIWQLPHNNRYKPVMICYRKPADLCTPETVGREPYAILPIDYQEIYVKRLNVPTVEVDKFDLYSFY